MARRKRYKYLTSQSHPRVIEHKDDLYRTIAGHRRSDFFQNTNPLVVELACGYGEYTTWLAKIFPDTNFVWIDIKWDRIWAWAQKIDEFWLKNAWFVRMIIHHLETVFSPWEIDDIRIVHPDPRPKTIDTKRRLTFKRFLDMYYKLLSKTWILRLKTDDADLFAYSLQSIQEHGKRTLQSVTHDLYTSPLLSEHHGIITHYEKKFVAAGRTVHYAVRQKN